MKKKYLLLFFIVSIVALNAQWTYDASFNHDAGNPNGLNTGIDNDISSPWVKVFETNSASVDAWSLPIQIPFNFDFFGQPVDYFKVSITGVLCFDTTVTALPPALNTNLPNAGLPNNSFLGMWDEFSSSAPIGSNDDMYSQVFGTAPNRQLWVKLYSLEKGNPSVSFHYGSFVLEETTNKLYYVSMYETGSALSTTVGVQQDNLVAVQYGDSTIAQETTNGTAYSDNDYYEFTPRLLVNDNIGVSALNNPTNPICSSVNDIEIELTNFGLNTVTSAIIEWEYNGVSQTPFSWSGNLLSGTSENVTIATNFPTVSGVNSFVINSSLPNGNVDALTSDDTISVTLNTGLNGVYSVNPSLPTSASNFQTLTEVQDNLNLYGVCGPVTFNLVAATFNNTLDLEYINGTSATNTITFNGVDTASTKITSLGSSISNATVSLTGVSNVSFNNLTIENTKSGTDTWGVFLTESCDYITIDNCKISLATSTSSDRAGVVSSGSNTSATSDGDNADHLTISNCLIENAYYGIYLNGEDATADFDDNIVIQNNTINAYYYGIYLDNIDTLTIVNNDITANGTSYSDGLTAQDIMSFNISNNKIYATDYGLYISDGNYDAPVSVQSNLVNNMVISETDYAFYFLDVVSTNVFHNSLYGEPAMRVGTPVDLDIRNNIFVSDNDYAFEDASGDITDYINLDYNLYFSQGTNLIDFGPSYTSLSDWQNADPSLNLNSLEGNPAFSSLTDLHLIGFIANDAGDNSVGILTDIDGDSRPQSPSTTVDIGADEYTPSGCAFPDNLNAFGTGPTSTEIYFNGYGAISWIIEYGPENFTLGNGTQVTSTNDTLTLSNLSATTTYDFYVKSVCSTDTSFWSPIKGSFTTPCDFESFPYFENFETVPTNTRGDFGNCWMGSGTTTSVYRWESENSTGSNENSTSTGPFYDKTLENIPGGIYLYTEASSGNDFDTTYLNSPLIDLSTALVPRISFWYHRYGSTMGDLLVQVTNDFSNWTTLTTLTGEQQTAGDDAWLNLKLDMSAFAGDTVQVRFVGVRGTDYYSDMSIDDISIEETPTNDISVIEQVSPQAIQCGSTTSPLIINVVNNGSLTQYNVPVTVELTGDFVGTYNAIIDSVVSLDTVEVNVGVYDNTAGGNVTVLSYTSNVGDQVPLNDSLITVAEIGFTPNAITVNSTSICEGDSVSFVNTSGYNARWMLAANDSVISENDTLTVAPNFTTSYKVEVYDLLSENVGETTPPTTGYTPSNNFYGITFETQTNITINSVVVYPSGTGSITLGLYDENLDSVVAQVTTSVTDGGTPYSPSLAVLDLDVPASTSQYRLVYLSGFGVINLGRSSSGSSFPYVSTNGLFSINRSSTSQTGSGSTYSYYFFYDWNITFNGCPSESTLFDVNVSGGSTANIVNINACDEFTYSGITVTTSGVYLDSLTTSIGCDSIVTYNVTLNSSSIDTQSFILCAPDTVIVNGNEYFSTGIYVDSLQTVSGCDSIITTNLTIDTPVAISLNGLTPEVCVNAGAITLNPEPLGGVFNGAGIVGNYFDPIVAGIGTHTITYDLSGLGGCNSFVNIDVEVINCTGIKDISGINAMTIYPNPFINTLNLTFNDSKSGELTINLFDVTGKVIVTKVVDSNIGVNNVEIVVPEFAASGVHIIQIERDGKTYTHSLLKK